MERRARIGLCLLLITGCNGPEKDHAPATFHTSSALNRQRAGCYVIGFGGWHDLRGPAAAWPRPWEYAEVRLALEPADSLGNTEWLRVGPAPSLGKDTVYMQKATGRGNEVWFVPSTSAFAVAWMPVARDSIALDNWSEGMGQTMRVEVRGDTLHGRAHRVLSDIRASDHEPRATVYGVRFDCAGSVTAARQALQRMLAADLPDSALGAREQRHYDSVAFPP